MVQVGRTYLLRFVDRFGAIAKHLDFVVMDGVNKRPSSLMDLDERFVEQRGVAKLPSSHIEEIAAAA